MTKTHDLVFTPDLGRSVALREGTSDRQVWADTFTGRYHIPPKSMAPPRRVLDLGANIGLTAAHYKRLWPAAEVVGVEPSPSNAALARLNAPNVEILDHAVMGIEGIGSYDERDRAEAFNVRMEREFVEGAVNHLVLTRCYPLLATARIAFGYDDVYANGVDFVKMDVEGAEWAIFADDEWPPYVRNLLVELHPDDRHPDDTEGLLADGAAALYRLGFSVEATTREKGGHPRGLWATR